MELRNSRKIIKFGKSSHVMTLPNSWILKHSLNPGDRLHVLSDGGTLVVLPQVKPQELSIEICCDIPFKIFNKTLVSFYLKNYSRIVIKGKNLFDQLEQIKMASEKLPFLEIIKVSKRKIVMRDLVSLKDLIVKDLIKEMVDVCSVIFSELGYINKDKSKCFLINSLDKNLNKICFLIYKSLNYNLHEIKNHKQAKNTVLYWRIVSSLEQLGDILKRIARYISQTSPKTLLPLLILIGSLEKYFQFVTSLSEENITLDKNLETYLNKKQSLLKSLDETRGTITSKLQVYFVFSQLYKDCIEQLDNIILSIIDLNNS